MKGNIASLFFVLPELVLTITTLAVLLLACWPKRGPTHARLSGLVTCVGVVAAFICLIVVGIAKSGQEHVLFMGMLAYDPLAVFFNGLFLLATLLTALFTFVSKDVERQLRPEYDLVLLAVCLGLCLVGAARDALMIYLALEMFSIGSYALVALNRDIRRSQEGGMKFILYGGVSTGLMLYGLSLLYGMAGTTNLARWYVAIGAVPGSATLVFVAFLFILVGAGYKIASVPFHFWCPDVYEAAPTPITAFLSVASNTGGFALLVRLCYTSLLTVSGGQWTVAQGIDWTLVLSIIAVATMTLGNLGAMAQNNLKRLLAYSGIAHGGYILLGAIALNNRGIEAMLFYMVAYLFTNLTAFLVVIHVANAQNSENISAYRGLGIRSPYLAACMALALVSLTGVPPTAGFAGKYYVFYAALTSDHYWLVMIALVNTVFSLYYYARILKAMYLESTEDAAPVPVPASVGWLLALAGAPILLLFIPGVEPLVRLVQSGAHLVGG